MNKLTMKNKLKFAALIGLTALLVTTVAADEHENISEDLEVPEEADQLPEEASEQASIRVPGDRLYFMTSISERVERGMARAPGIGGADRQAQVEANHAQRRLAEAEELSNRGDSERAQQAVERYSQGIQRASEAANRSGNPETQQRIAEASQSQQERLQGLRDRLPQEAQQGIETAIENSQRAREAAGGPPQDAGPRNQTEGPEQRPNQAQGQSERGQSEDRTQQESETQRDSEQEQDNQTEESGAEVTENGDNQSNTPN